MIIIIIIYNLEFWMVLTNSHYLFSILIYALSLSIDTSYIIYFILISHKHTQISYIYSTINPKQKIIPEKCRESVNYKREPLKFGHQKTMWLINVRFSSIKPKLYSTMHFNILPAISTCNGYAQGTHTFATTIFSAHRIETW